MRATIAGLLTTFAISAALPASLQAQTVPPSATMATDVTAEEIAAVLKNLKGGDEEIRIVDVGKENLGVAVLHRAALKPGPTVTALNHVQLTEIYYVISGSGTLMTGGEVSSVKPLPPDHNLVTTVVGPTNTAVFTKPAQTRLVKQGDVVVIPAGVYHGWSEVPITSTTSRFARIRYAYCRPATSIRPSRSNDGPVRRIAATTISGQRAGTGRGVDDHRRRSAA